MVDVAKGELRVLDGMSPSVGDTPPVCEIGTGATGEIVVIAEEPPPLIENVFFIPAVTSSDLSSRRSPDFDLIVIS